MLVILLLILALVLLPFVEVAVLVWVAGQLTWPITLFLLMVTSGAGWLVLTRTLNTSLKAATFDVARTRGSVGRVVADRLIWTVAALLLLIPGFVTGGLGLLLMVPPIRAAASRRLVDGFRGSITTTVVNASPPSRRHDVIDVDVVDAAPTQPVRDEAPELG